MVRARVWIGLVVVAFFSGGFLVGDEPKKETPPPKVKGQLPAGWSKLGLTDSQKQQIYKTDAEYRTKIDALEAQIKDLKKQRKAELEKVLTEGQKTRLKEILAEKGPSETSTKDDKKPDKDKKPERTTDPSKDK
jgi:hypothetical protein